MGFPHISVGKESVCNAGDPGLIPGLGRSAAEGMGYPLQYSWASLVAQLVKNLPAMQETQETVSMLYSPWGCTRPASTRATEEKNGLCSPCPVVPTVVLCC